MVNLRSSPFNFQKRVKIGENKITSKLLDSIWTPLSLVLLLKNALYVLRNPQNKEMVTGTLKMLRCLDLKHTKNN